MRLIILALLTSIVGGFLAPTARQTPARVPAAQAPTFRAGVDLVQLDVTVLDKDRQPVRGLTAHDFAVLENGVPQAVQAFSAVDLPNDTATASASWVRDVTPDVTTNSIPSTGRVFVIVLDDAVMPADLWGIETTRKTAEGVVNRMRPDDLAAVVFTKDGHGAQGLTSDRAKLLAAVNSLSRFGGAAGAGRQLPFGRGQHPCVDPASCPPDVTAPLCSAYRQSITVVEDAANFLAALPGRRKSIVYITGGMSVDTSVGRIVGRIYPTTEDERLQCGAQVVFDMKNMFRLAEQANVTVYGFDPEGLRPDAHLSNDDPGGKAIQFVQEVSENTGGRPTINTNDLEPGVTQMFVENSSYYLVGYRPSNVKADGTFRRIEVKVDRPDVEVRTRHDYWAPTAKDAAKPPPPPGMTALADIVPKTDWPMRVDLAPFATGTSSAVAIALGLERKAQPNRIAERVELIVRAFAPEGEAKGTLDEAVPVSLPPAESAADVTRYDILASLPLPAGRYELRVSAHSTTLDTRGSVYADVIVPDFAKAPVSLSGVLVTIAPNETAAPRLVLSPIVPVVPTSERTITTAEHVSTFLRIYESAHQQPEPVTLETRVTNASNATVSDRHELFPAQAFDATRATEIRYALPVSTLPSGDYLLTFEASSGKTTARRDVRFTVK